MTAFFQEDWFSLLSGFAIFIMGLRVYWLDSNRRMYQAFMVSTFLLFVQNIFFFQMGTVTEMAEILPLRTWQENVWNLAILFITMTMWYYAQQFAPREMFWWEKRVYQVALAWGVILVILQGWTPYQHGNIVMSEAGKWAIELKTYQLHDVFRLLGVIVIYSTSIYLSYLPYRYASNSQTRGIRLAIFGVYGLIMVVSFIENYIVTYFWGWACPLNESINVAVGALFSGLMIINLQLTDLQSEYAVPNLLKTMTNWFILTDADFRVKQVNAAFLDYMGHNAKYWQDRPLTEVFPEEHWQRNQRIFSRLDSNATQAYETRLETKDQPAYLFFLVTPLFKNLWDGGRNKKRGYVFVGTDLTRFKASEEQIRAYAAELEVSNQALERFAYIASHDLKEPIRNIGNFAGLLRRRLPPEAKPQLGEYINFIEDSVEGMNQLIEAVMAISRLGQEALNWELTDLNEVLLEVEKRLEKRLLEKKVQLHRHPLPKLIGDQQLLQQLFQNLVDNALKYNESDQPRIEINFELDHEQAVYRFYISDNGIGIEPQYREAVFDMFRRLHSRGKYPGTGIGLAICRRIVELHHGKIWIADSPPQTGTVFVVELPAQS